MALPRDDSIGRLRSSSSFGVRRSRYPDSDASVIFSAGAVGLLALARWAGLSWQEVGLGAETWRRGVIWASGAIGAVAVVFAVGAALPLTRDVFRDTRYDLDWEHALRTAFLLIPLGTVLFGGGLPRGVVGAAAAGTPDVGRSVVSSVLFGLWHVLPSLGPGRGQPGDRECGRKGNVRRGYFGAGNGPVHWPVGGGVLQGFAAAQRQPARVSWAALGDQRAGCTRSRVHLGVGILPVTGEAAA